MRVPLSLLFLLMPILWASSQDNLNLFSPIENPCGLPLEKYFPFPWENDRELRERARSILKNYFKIYSLIRNMRTKDSVALKIAFTTRLYADMEDFQALKWNKNRWGKREYTKCFDLMESHSRFLQREIDEREKSMPRLIWEEMSSLFG